VPLSTLFVANKDEWDTKEGHGKSMKNVLHVQWYGKIARDGFYLLRKSSVVTTLITKVLLNSC